MKLSEYVESLKKNDPGFNRGLKEWLKFTPPKRKVKFFLDRNLPDEFKEAVKAYHLFKVIAIAKENDSDELIWNTAKRKHTIILSLDKGDFWNDKKFPLHESPGVILISSREQSIDTYINTLVLFMLNTGIVDGIRRYPDYLKKMKFKISANGLVHKFINNKGSLEEKNIEYD